jgi:diguanylate cyclase (GGDEF)-like protein
MDNSKRLVAALRALPPLTVATATMYGSSATLLCAGAVTWVPGKNPRWVILTLAIVAVIFFAWTLVRGRRFTTSEALVMITAQLFTLASLTWTTHLELGAFANGTVLPIIGVYVIWFLHPVAGRVVLFLGTAAWVAAIIHQDNRVLVPFAGSLVVEAIIATEVFARIKWRMDHVARTDQLTDTLNRRGIYEVLEREVARSQKRGQSLSVVAIDLDGLRTVNNTLGHRAGDRLLAQATRYWVANLRRDDSVGRTGGDEFLFVLPGTTLEQAHQIVHELAAHSPGSWSAGVAMAKPGDDTESLLERADRRMYRQKATRRGAEMPSGSDGPTVQI